MCTIKETEILLADQTYVTLSSILDKNNINYKIIESNNDIGWYPILPFEIQLVDKTQLCTKLFYNGNICVYKILFDDDFEIILTGSHKLLTSIGIWITIDDLDNQYEIKTYTGGLKNIISIEKLNNQETWDFHIKEDHYYILKNGVISHNS